VGATARTRYRWPIAERKQQLAGKQLEDARAKLDMLRRGPAAPTEMSAAAALSRVREQLKRREWTDAPPAPSPADLEPTADPAFPADPPSEQDRGEIRWLADALRAIAGEDRDTAGEILVSLLPAQAIATPRWLSYDLTLTGDRSYAVDVDQASVRIEERPEPRPLEETDARITATLAQLGDLVLRGSQGLRLSPRRRPIAVEGERARLHDLVALARAPLSLATLRDAGVSLRTELLLRMIASAIGDSWTMGLRFTIAFEPAGRLGPTCYLRVNDGRPATIGRQLPLDLPAAVVRCSDRALMHLLTGIEPALGDAVTIAGPSPQTVTLVCRWVRQLERGRSKRPYAGSS
jgi:hypothetical protein